MTPEIERLAKVKQTMDERYGDGSDHIACLSCGLCRSCGDCKCPKVVKPARGDLKDAAK